MSQMLRRAKDCNQKDPVSDAVAAIEPIADLTNLQFSLEAAAGAQARARGEERFKKRDGRGAGVETAYGAQAIADAIDAVASAIREDREQYSAQRGARPEALRLLAPLEEEAAAYLTLRALVDQLAHLPKLSTAAVRIGGLLEREILLRAQEQCEAQGEAEGKERGENRAKQSARKARRRSRPTLSAKNLKTLKKMRWTTRQRQLCGARMLHLAMAATNIAEVIEEKGGRGNAKQVRRLSPSDHMVAARSRERSAAAFLAPIHEPMVVPPKPWRGVRGGGYLSRTANDLTLIKTRDLRALSCVTPESAPVVFQAVNAAQRTAWRVNARILSTMLACEENRALCPEAPIPQSAPQPRPSPDAPGDLRWAWWEEERRRRSRRLAWDRMLAQAQRYRKMPQIYFPHQYDFRGRLYAAPEFSPQGPDPMRGLLRFARALPLGAEGWKWLAIHLCNSGDFERMSKAPLIARAEWTIRNEERILTVAADPLADLWWAEADQPWQFLAACFEWEGFRREGESFQSSLPIALDGSCSGIQHFSLALRDEIGGAAVNLSARPEDAAASDIYAEVAQAVEAMLRADLNNSRAFCVGRDGDGRKKMRPVADLARAWLEFGISRSLCKRPTMTYGYGARGYGYVDQIFEDTLAPAHAAFKSDPSAPWPFEGRGFGEALYLSAKMTEAIESTVLKAAEAMRWLQQVADRAAAEGVPLQWTTPDGFRVVQAYQMRSERRVKTLVTGKPVRLTLREETNKLDARRQRQGVAPNFVHSLDACHLRLTVAQAEAEGLVDLALVHDSFAAHAAHTPRFFQLIRETMVSMYDGADVINAFRDEIAASLSDKGKAALSAPPQPGALCLDAVLESEHCFS